MKLPGRGWLEFEVTPLDGGQRSRITQTATFDPRGVLGRAYWNAVLPLHAVIFRGMLGSLARRAYNEPPVRASRAAAAILAALSVAGSVMPLSAQSRPAVRTVSSVNLDRYAGVWFEIARFPNRFQRRCISDVTAQYGRRSDGRLDVINRCRTDKGSIEAKGIARTADSTAAKLKVRFAPAVLSFIPAVWGDYWVVALDDDYAWALVGSPDHDYLWILSRTPTLADATYQQVVAAARANGFDIDRIVRTVQTGAAPDAKAAASRAAAQNRTPTFATAAFNQAKVYTRLTSAPPSIVR
jgi:apolipoprotein D and lipocalin family protein